MKALVYEGPWKLSVHEVPDSRPGPGEVLLRSEAVGICGSDVHGFTGESGRRKPGMVMGHEVVGRVVELGPGATRFQLGDRVTVYNINGCKKCRFCLAGREQLCPDRRILGVNAGGWGAMAERFAFPESGLVKVDADVDPAVALLAEPIAVGIHAINLMQPASDDLLAVVGTGTVGIGLVIALRARGFKWVFALDKVPDKLKLIADLGATPVNIQSEDAIAHIRQATKDAGVNGVFEAVGTAEGVDTAYQLCGVGGTIVLIGNLAKTVTFPLQGLTDREITVRGSYGFTKEDFSAAVSLAVREHASLQRLITGSCSLDETPGVMAGLAKGERTVIKMVIRPE